MFPSWRQWKQLPKVLNGAEKRTISALASIAVIAGLILGGTYVATHRVVIPAVGGEYTEGLIGEPQFINPLYASSSDVDQDLERLIYSGLLKWSPEDGYVPDLAESIEVNDDATVYTFTIREGAKFHNGDDVLARDVIFTINAIQNPAYRSPLIDNFHSATIVQEDDRTISFILEESTPDFRQHLCVGILPANLWADVLPQNAALTALNIQPIGSGPYQFAEYTKDQKGSIRNYTLERNPDFYAETALIETLTFKFYPDAFALAEALENKNVEGASVVTYEHRETVEENKNVSLVQPRMPQEVVLYMNDELNPVLSDLVIRSAIAQTIDKQSIVDNVYQEGADVIEGMLLSGMIGYHDELESAHNPEQAASDLDEAGYTLIEGSTQRQIKSSLQEELTEEEEEDETETAETAEEVTPEVQAVIFTLTTADTSEMRLVAGEIKDDLEAIGIAVELNFVSQAFLPGEVIEPRNFELLLLPLILEANPDPYLFWHSSQGNGVGLNIVNYENDDVDTLLEDAQTQTDIEARATAYKQAQELIAEDLPAIFLYQPRYNYAVASKITMDEIQQIMIPSDRFAHITSWYIKTKKALQ
ncbi:MAG: peptide ABC transporter substrate-binding protein [bacterium]|nr:peptide ABC transporter substrate-binding protein [bacterium]